MIGSPTILLITVYFLFIFVFSFRVVYAIPTKHLCRPEQRDPLLELKKELEVSCGIYSWGNNSNCCRWEGITCDANSGEVIKLHLSHMVTVASMVKSRLG